jgi:hypothetical protein
VNLYSVIFSGNSCRPNQQGINSYVRIFYFYIIIIVKHYKFMNVVFDTKEFVFIIMTIHQKVFNFGIFKYLKLLFSYNSRQRSLFWTANFSEPACVTSGKTYISGCDAGYSEPVHIYRLLLWFTQQLF